MAMGREQKQKREVRGRMQNRREISRSERSEIYLPMRSFFTSSNRALPFWAACDEPQPLGAAYKQSSPPAPRT
jgi:hypothetical protein